jgi:hypothetical protein
MSAEEAGGGGGAQDGAARLASAHGTPGAGPQQDQGST